MKVLKNFIGTNISTSFYLAYRRLLPKSHTSQIALLPKLAFLSITIGVAASILILSLTNGLHNNYLTRLAEKDAHISIISAGKGIPAYQEIISKIKLIKGTLQVFPYSQNEALIKSYDETRGVVIKSYQSDFIKDKSFNKIFQLVEGTWSFDKKRTIVIGEALAKNLSLFINDYIELLTYDETFGAITYRLKIIGIFTAYDALMDTGLAFLNFEDAGEIFGFQGYAPNIGIRVEDYVHLQKYLSHLEKITPFRYKTWKLTNLNTLLALENEKRIIQILLVIFFCVAFFGVLAVITALVADKQEEIALLKALGMTPQENAFSLMIMGLLLGIVASIIGIILGVFLSLQFNNIIKILEYMINLLIQSYHVIIKEPYFHKFTFLNQSVYYLKEFPILIKISDIVFTCCMAITCTLLAALYPAHISKEFRPAEILRKRIA